MLSVFKNINIFAKKWKALDVLAIFLARALPYLMVGFLFFYYIYVSNLYLFFYAVLAGLFARFILNELAHLFYKEKRPAQAGQVNVLIPVPKNYSFPSGHASFFFGMSFFLFFYSIPLFIVFIICSCFIGIARVFCGVHWFRDIVAGAFAGFLSAIITNSLLNYIKL